ncbi:MAG: ferredoxin--NADP reductase [Methylohalobius sp.]|nr:ferredoxin--NADP reductase [Methylohalobius sp.]
MNIDPAKWYPGQVVGLHRWTNALYSLRVQAEVEPFEAGQFGRLGLVLDGELVTRPYSFVNAPSERPLDFYFIVVPEGKLTPKLAALQPGDTVWVARKPSGFFTLSQVPVARFLWLLATGTALGPFLSILKTELPWQRFEKIVLVHGVRACAELTYQETIARFQRVHANQFQFFASVTREPCLEALPIRIPRAIESGLLEERADLPLDPKDSQVMICGNPEMVKATVALLQNRGFRENARKSPGQITTERYW